MRVTAIARFPLTKLLNIHGCTDSERVHFCSYKTAGISPGFEPETPLTWSEYVTTMPPGRHCRMRPCCHSSDMWWIITVPITPSARREGRPGNHNGVVKGGGTTGASCPPKSARARTQLSGRLIIGTSWLYRWH